MREIKFRIWDDRIKKMGIVTELRYSEVQYHLVKYRYTDERGRTIDNQTHFDKGYSGGITLMQYTGVNDNNDTEIYEGDILEWSRKDLKTGETNKEMFEVVFIDGAFMGMNIKNYNPKYQLLNDIVSWCDCEFTKLIGNIYENPELLETN
ncbi:MAG: hypothetical protein EWM50_05510 [Gottschalkiaceae bacterium]|nr:MAG: hypothetical protein EWM50_05510 [Gottschalkiaceae bacterium]